MVEVPDSANTLLLMIYFVCSYTHLKVYLVHYEIYECDPWLFCSYNVAYIRHVT